MKKLKEYSLVTGIGAVIYSLVEIIFRGYTHWTMTVTGGVTFLALYFMNLRMKTKSLFLRCVAGSLIITVIEFVVGCLVNLRLKWNVWDYSSRAHNLLGQICPLFTVLWFLLCIPATLLCAYLKHRLTGERMKISLKFNWF